MRLALKRLAAFCLGAACLLMLNAGYIQHTVPADLTRSKRADVEPNNHAQSNSTAGNNTSLVVLESSTVPYFFDLTLQPSTIDTEFSQSTTFVEDTSTQHISGFSHQATAITSTASLLSVFSKHSVSLSLLTSDSTELSTSFVASSSISSVVTDPMYLTGFSLLISSNSLSYYVSTISQSGLSPTIVPSSGDQYSQSISTVSSHSIQNFSPTVTENPTPNVSSSVTPHTLSSNLEGTSPTLLSSPSFTDSISFSIDPVATSSFSQISARYLELTLDTKPITNMSPLVSDTSSPLQSNTPESQLNMLTSLGISALSSKNFLPTVSAFSPSLISLEGSSTLALGTQTSGQPTTLHTGSGSIPATTIFPSPSPEPVTSHKDMSISDLDSISSTLTLPSISTSSLSTTPFISAQAATSQVSTLTSDIIRPSSVWPGTSSQQVTPTSTEKATPAKKSSPGLSTGGKIALGIIIPVAIIGLIVLVIFVYRRYNVSHKGFKDFFQTTVRYRTYANDSYNEDEVGIGGSWRRLSEP